jgi:hypothetical protein
VFKPTSQSEYELERHFGCCVCNDIYLIVYQYPFTHTGNTTRIEQAIMQTDVV